MANQRFWEFLSLAIFNFEFLYPDKEHSSESLETNDKNGFWKKKIEVLVIENRLQIFFPHGRISNIWTKIFPGDFQW